MDSEQTSPRLTRLDEYQPPAYWVRTVDLSFDLGDERTVVHNCMTVERNAQSDNDALVLNGGAQELLRVCLDGRELSADDFVRDENSLHILNAPQHCTLEITTVINPRANSSLMGLYQSRGIFCTQCEAEGFRKITYYPDRPDVMAIFTTTIRADRVQCPVLLSNGNCVSTGDADGGRHWAKWHDPFPKPAYLFALVAGDLACLADEFVTTSGRRVALHLYAQHHNIKKCAHAMQSLQKAMAWDEKVYGREYDLDIYMIVAGDDFNMGAMENKGLNVFNSRYVLADARVATDSDYEAIEGVIAHEYFHNWSGNRVTCRDWFQLSLKEGFTVFRDQQFSAEHTSRGVRRIGDANIMRTHQFREDAGPMAHAVQPRVYAEINNFYTLTVYNKGAEVVRMMHTLLGARAFRKGTDLYFARHDGEAVTIEEFVRAMEDASNLNLKQFRRWYSQAGTPVLSIRWRHDEKSRALHVSLQQHCPPSAQQSSQRKNKKPFHIPVRIALLNDDGRHYKLKPCVDSSPDSIDGDSDSDASDNNESVPAVSVHHGNNGDEGLIHLRTTHLNIRFDEISEAPLVSALRGFSAPVRLDMEEDATTLARRMASDSDAFNRWDAAQRYACTVLLARVHMLRAQGCGQETQSKLPLDAGFSEAFARNLKADINDKSLQAMMLNLPDEIYLGEQMEGNIDPDAVHHARRSLQRALTDAHRAQLLHIYEREQDAGLYHFDALSVGRRRLKNACLALLGVLSEADITALAVRQFETAGNMSDVMAALAVLCDKEGDVRTDALQKFYDKWRDEPLVLDKWLAMQAASRLPGTVKAVRALSEHAAFNIRNPNKVYSLLGTFANRNPLHFHAADGSGYKLLGDFIVRIDPMNPQVAARLAVSFAPWRRYDQARREMMKEQMQRIVVRDDVSSDVREIITRSLSEIDASDA